MAPINRPVVMQTQPRPMMPPSQLRNIAPLMVHPAPLPEISQLGHHNPAWKKSPPKPKLKISKLKTGSYYYP